MTTRTRRKAAPVVYVDSASESEEEIAPPKRKRTKKIDDPDFDDVDGGSPSKPARKRTVKEPKEPKEPKPKRAPVKRKKKEDIEEKPVLNDEHPNESEIDQKPGDLNGTDEDHKTLSVGGEEKEEQPKAKRPRKKAAPKSKETKAEDKDDDEEAEKEETKPKRPRNKAEPKAKDGGNNFNRSDGRMWQVSDLLAELEDLDFRSSRNIVSLFEDDNTIPFICRYRRDMIRDDINAEKLRQIKTTYNNILDLKKKAETIVNQLAKDDVLTENIRHQMLCAKSMEELEFLYAPYKPASKGSLLDKALSLGLEQPANYILDGLSPPMRLEQLVDLNSPDLDTVDKVATNIGHIISHTLSKSTEVLEEIRRLQKYHRIILKSQKAKPTKDKKNEEKENHSHKGGNKSDESKYENYFNFQNDVRYVKPHQVLAINRGEKAKVLTVKVEIPDDLEYKLKGFIHHKFFSKGVFYSLRANLLQKTYEECYSKKIKPLMVRQIRSNLNEKAKQAAVEMFAQNLKQLLMMAPLKGKKILGIDPGFSNGCKLALISETADLLTSDVIYPHTKYGNSDEFGEKLRMMLNAFQCEVIAIGNGTACRETEFWITKLYEDGILNPDRVKYCIVSEQGASIYSCGDIAKKEFPNLDVNLISAVSIARRLNDPLSEYVKIEPKHIGVGMYQHDVNEKTLSETLNEVVSECVSFVGVDINTVSVTALKHIAGLSNSRAEKIIEHRIKNGMFHSRKDLLKVKTIGEKTFTQCAGFIRIEPLTVGDSVKINLLDCTWIHPESYDIAKAIISKNNLRINDIGKDDFIRKIKSFADSSRLEDLEEEYKVPKERIQTILNALQREFLKDYRSDFGKEPLFKQGITKLSELRPGTEVTGSVRNVTHFGAFVDIGVEVDGLLHTSKMNGLVLSIGDRVELMVADIDIARRRIQLKVPDS